MATVQGVTVVVGDWLRCTADDWEGQVTDVDNPAGTVTLQMNSGDIRTAAVGDVHFNWWDPRLTSGGGA